MLAQSARMYRMLAPLLLCWTITKVNSQLLTSVSNGVGDDSLTFNCGSDFSKANTTGYFSVEPDVIQLDSSTGLAPTVSAGVTVLQGSGNQSNAIQWSIWYNTGGANYSNDIGLGYDVCAFTFPTYSINTLYRAQTDTGNCYATFDQDCVAALTSAASGFADALINNATPEPNSNLTASQLPRVCYDIGQALEQNFPAECQVFMNSSLPLTAGGFALTGNGSSPLWNGCDLTSNKDDQPYHLLTTVNTVVPSSEKEIYYSAMNWQVVPSLLTFMPLVNIKAPQSIGSSNSKMTCLRANHVNPGNVEPSPAPSPTPIGGGGGLSTGAIAGLVIGVVVGVALIAGAAFWFWRRRRQQRESTSTEAAITAEPPPAYHDETKGHVQQPTVAEAPTDAGVKELSPDNEVRPELGDTYKPQLKRGNTDAPIELPADAGSNVVRS